MAPARQHTIPMLADALASTSTLVNEAPPRTLVFDRNSVHGATLHAPTGPAYRVAMTSTLRRTELHVLAVPDNHVVATVRKRDLLPDLIMLPHRGDAPLKVKKWLQQRKARRAEEYVLATLAGDFVWRSDDMHRFALYPEGQTQQPIAHAKLLQDPPTMSLVLQAGFEEIEVEVIASFLILEHKLRMREKMEQGELMLALTGNGIFFVGY